MFWFFLGGVGGLLWLLSSSDSQAQAGATGQPVGDSGAGSTWGQEWVNEAASDTYQGKPYKWGGAGPDGFDCSGFLYAAAQAIGKSTPRTAAGFAEVARPVSEEVARSTPGALAFWSNGSRIYHVELSAGDGTILGSRVKAGVSRWRWGWWGASQVMAFGVLD